MIPVKIEYVDYIVAEYSPELGTIFLHHDMLLPGWEYLHDSALEHEKRHHFAENDLALNLFIDFKDGFNLRSKLDLFLFYIDHPKATFRSFMPIWYDKINNRLEYKPGIAIALCLNMIVYSALLWLIF